MIILHINTTDKGGAGEACLRLHEGLLDSGVESYVLVADKSKDNIPNLFRFYETVSQNIFDKIKQTKIYRKLYYEYYRAKMDKIYALNFDNRNIEIKSFPFSDKDITRSSLYKKADIIHLHWISGFVDFKTFFNKCKKPIVWTFHDMNPFLGLQHFDEKFLGPDKSGFPLTKTMNKKELAIENKYIEFKRKVYNNTFINIITPSKWMADEVMTSNIIPRYSLNVIPNSINISKFQLLNKFESKNKFDISQSKKTILFVAEHAGSNRKGFYYLQAALKNMNSDDLLTVSVGNIVNTTIPNIVKLGRINDFRIINTAYCAADVFIIPSLMDNLPNTVIESLVCGTPVIGFPSGGITEMIEDGKNGILAEEISVDALQKAINRFFEEGVSFSSEQIREDAIKKYSLQVQSEKVINLYKSILQCSNSQSLQST